jgi:putative ABC transport system permease protein
MLDTMVQDTRYAFRVLWRAPRNSAIAIAILGLGIGANTAMFSAVNHVVLRPLPFADADRLLRVRDAVTSVDGQVHAFNMSGRHVAALKELNQVFDGFVAFSGGTMTLTGGDVPERLSVVSQTVGIDGTLGIRPTAGRAFSDDDTRQGPASGVALISDALWQSHFGRAPSAIGATLRLDGRAFTVIGVMPPRYAFPYDAQVWLPCALDASDQSREFAVFGHLRRGISGAQARESLGQTAALIAQRTADTLPHYGLDVMTIRENVIGTQDAPLRALTDIVVFLLLISCVNVATLLLARSVARRREFAIRSVLGAAPSRHLRQLLTESLVLAGLGCGAGLLIAAWIAPLTAALVPSVLREQLGRTTPQSDWRVLTFAIGASLASAMIAGLVPALGGWRRDPRLALSDDGRTASGGPGGRRMLGALIVVETALTLMLLAGAGLVIRNFVRLQTLPLGFRAHGLLTLELTPPAAAYPPGPRRSELARQMVERVRATPGVLAAAITTVNPLGGGTWGASVITEEMASQDPNAALNVNHRLITPGLLETMGIPLLRGRAFTEEDRAATQPIAIVSDRLARRFWPHDDAIGKRIRIARPGTPWLTVIGIAGDVSDSHDAGVPVETWYLPLAQHAETAAAEHFYVMVRSGGDALALTSAVQRAIVAVDKTLAPYAPAAMDSYYAESLSRERIGAAFMLAFGLFGLALAALGVYGVMAFSVAQRTMEIGIRMALGARVADILPLMLRRAIALVAMGAGAGVLGAAGLNRVLASLLTGIGGVDAGVLCGASVLIVVAAAIACVVPALTAARLDPVTALKADG